MTSYQGNAALISAPQTYQDAADALGSRDMRKIGNNTWLQADGDDIQVILHETAIVTFKRDGSVVLNSGGWNTPTTRGRMSKFIEARSSSVCSNVKKGGLCVWNWDERTYTPFPDGQRITLPPMG